MRQRLARLLPLCSVALVAEAIGTGEAGTVGVLLGAMTAMVAVIAMAVVVATGPPEATTPRHAVDTAVDMVVAAGTATILLGTTTEDLHLTVAVGGMEEILMVVGTLSHGAGVATVAADMEEEAGGVMAAAAAGTLMQGTTTPAATSGPTGIHTGAHLQMTDMHPAAAAVGVAMEVALLAATPPDDEGSLRDCCKMMELNHGNSTVQQSCSCARCCESRTSTARLGQPNLAVYRPYLLSWVASEMCGSSLRSVCGVKTASRLPSLLLDRLISIDSHAAQSGQKQGGRLSDRAVVRQSNYQTAQLWHEARPVCEQPSLDLVSAYDL